MTLALNTNDHIDQNSVSDTDETVLWRGRPDRAIRFQKSKIKDVIFGLVIVTIGCAAFVTGYRVGDPGTVIGVLFILAGIWKAFGWVLRPMITQGRTEYFVTRSRACKRYRTLFGKVRLSCIPMTQRTAIEVEDGEPPSIILRNTDAEKLVFQDIYEAHQIVVEIRRIQKDVL